MLNFGVSSVIVSKLFCILVKPFNKVFPLRLFLLERSPSVQTGILTLHVLTWVLLILKGYCILIQFSLSLTSAII